MTGGILWSNLHLLFWLSLIPLGTACIGETRLAPVPTAIYGAILLLSGDPPSSSARWRICWRPTIGRDADVPPGPASYCLRGWTVITGLSLGPNGHGADAELDDTVIFEM